MATVEVELHGTSVDLSSGWCPHIDPEVDYTQWGPWEARQHATQTPEGPVATGDWIAWNRESGDAMQFSDSPNVTAREQAVFYCRIAHGELVPTQECTWVLALGAPRTREVFFL